MPEPERKAADVIDAYRRRRERTIPLLLGGLAIVLLVIGIFLVVVWLSGGGKLQLPGFLSRRTDTPTPTATIPSPTPTLATPTETPTPSITPTAAVTTYLVEPGDTLLTIATKFEVDWLLLMVVNNIRDANAIQVGQQLTIPPKEAEFPTPTALPTNLAPGQEIEYLVMPGDMLQVIAARYNSTVDAISRRNKISDPSKIQVGVWLIIPWGIVTPVPTATPRPGTVTPAPTLTPTATRTP